MPRFWAVRSTLVFLLGCGAACGPVRQAAPPSDYLGQAFSTLGENPPSPLAPQEQEQVQRIAIDLRKNASQKKPPAFPQSHATALGYRAFPAIAPLLKDPDPWVRASAMSVLFGLDVRRSIPFLVGMLLDTGNIQYRDDDLFIDTQVSRQAAGLLSTAYHGVVDFQTPLDEIGRPLAEQRAQQRWWAYHLAYCDWKDLPSGAQCWLNSRALYTHIPAEEFVERLELEPDRFKYLPIVWLQPSPYSSFTVKSRSIHVNLIFENKGTENPPSPDSTERGTHVFRLIGPDGHDVPPTSKLNEIVKNAVIIPPVFTWNAYSWDIDLGAAYDISDPGRYRLYYSYVPPRSLRNSIYGKTFELSWWNGREYANYFEFLIR